MSANLEQEYTERLGERTDCTELEKLQKLCGGGNLG